MSREQLLHASAAEAMIDQARQIVTEAVRNLHIVQSGGTGCADHALVPLIGVIKELEISLARVGILIQRIK